MDLVDALQPNVRSSIPKILTGLVTRRRMVSLDNNSNLCMEVVNRCSSKILIRMVNINNQWEEDKEAIRKTFLVEMEQVALSPIACSNTTLLKICSNNNNNLNKTNSAQSHLTNRISKTRNSKFTQRAVQRTSHALLLKLILKYRTISVDNLLNHYAKE